MHAPNAATTRNSVLPARRWMGRRARKSAAAKDPTAGAVRRSPRPVGPTSRMSFAKIGRSATAPPSRTAKRSSEIAPSSTFVRRMSRTPASTSSRPAAPSTAGSRPLRSASTQTSATSAMPTADRVDELGLDREQDPAGRRTRDERQLERDGALGERAHQDLLGHERRRQRATGGRPDRTGDARREREREERPDLVRAAQRHQQAGRRGRRSPSRPRTRRWLAAGRGPRAAPPAARAVGAGGTPRARRARGRAGSREPRRPASRWRPSPSATRKTR